MASLIHRRENEPGYFILIASHIDFEPFTKSIDIIKYLAKEHYIWLASDFTPFKREFKKGDRVILYAAGKKARQAVGDAIIAGPIEKATSEDLNIAQKLGLDGFNQRIPLSNVRLWETPVPIGPIAGKLSFIKDIRYWGQHFRQGASRISMGDYHLILLEAGVEEPK